jgi:RNA polymerase sigma factor (sigma-70 family)
MSDGELLRASRSDAAAFEELFVRTSGEVWRFLERRTGNREVARELTAETFARAWLCREAFVAEGHPATPWLYGIAKMILRESFRRQELDRRARDRLGLEALVQDVEDVAFQETWSEDVGEALAALPPHERIALLLRFEHDLAYDEMARRFKITPVAARSRVFRGLASLRQTLSAANR